MKCEVENTDDFGDWWASFAEDEQVSLAASVRLLEERGPTLGFPAAAAVALAVLATSLAAAALLSGGRRRLGRWAQAQRARLLPRGDAAA